MREIRSPLDGISSPFASRRFTPSLLFRANEPGYVYDLNDVATLFKDTAGTQPVTATADPVALRLDKSRGLALGAELVTNGDFSSGLTGWSFTGAAPLPTVVGGAATFVGGAASNRFIGQAGKLVVGRTYLVSATVTVSAGMIGPDMTGYAANVSVSGTYTWRLQASITTLSFIATNNFVGTIDNISVRELAGNHATQSDLTKRPLYSLLPANGVRNLANGSASVGDVAVWGATFTNAGITVTKVESGFDTDGLPYVDWQVSGTASATSGLSIYSIGLSRIPATVGQQFSCSFIARLVAGVAPSAGNGIRPEIIGETAPSTVTEFFSPSLSVPATDTILSASGTLVNGATNQVRGAPAVAFTIGAVLNFTVRIKALQFELGAARTAYQFNYAATNIAEPPFSQVGALLYDGVDDFMVTSAVDFSGTDEVFLCHGVRKASDAARAIVAELGDGGLAGGDWNLNAPIAASATYTFRSRGSVLASANSAASFAAPDTAVLTCQGKISTDTAILRRNGTQVATTVTDQGTGNYSNAPIYFGGRGGTSLFFKGYEFSSICRGRTPTAAQIAGSEGWVRARTAGAY